MILLQAFIATGPSFPGPLLALLKILVHTAPLVPTSSTSPLHILLPIFSAQRFSMAAETEAPAAPVAPEYEPKKTTYCGSTSCPSLSCVAKQILGSVADHACIQSVRYHRK